MAQHLRLPLSVGPTGRLATVAADSPEDVAQSLALLASTRPGERLSVPGYGSISPLFRTQVDALDGLVAAAAQWETRADPYAISIDTSDAGSPQAPAVTISGETR